MTWTAVGARARGLTTRLVPDDALDAIDRAADPAALAALLVRAGVVPPPGTATPAAIDAAVRARAAEDLAILSRWSGDRAAALDVIALDEDRRSLRAIVRGIAAGAPAERRLEGTVPTARLPAPVLAALAAAATAGEVAALLARRAHPFAAAIAAAGAHAPIDLLELELALARRFVELARRARRAGGAALRTHLAQVIDADHAVAALLLAARGDDLDPARAFQPGGQRIDRATFTAAASGPLDAARDRLARALAGTPLARAVAAADPSAVEDAALAWHVATQARLRRTDPHGLAPVLHLVLRRRVEAHQLRRAAWRVALAGGAP